MVNVFAVVIFATFLVVRMNSLEMHASAFLRLMGERCARHPVDLSEDAQKTNHQCYESCILQTMNMKNGKLVSRENVIDIFDKDLTANVPRSGISTGQLASQCFTRANAKNHTCEIAHTLTDCFEDGLGGNSDE